MSKRRLSFPAFRFLTRRSRAIKERLTTSGRLLLVGIVISGLLIVDVIQTQAYQAFSLLSSLLLVAVLWSIRFRAHILLERQLPRHATVGQLLEYTVRLTNRSTLVQDNLQVMEAFPDCYPTLDEFLNTTEPGEHRRNWFDRRVAYHRYLWLLRKKQGFHRKAVAIPRTPAQGTCRIVLSLTPNRRGRVELPGLTVMRPDPFGLILAHQRHPLPASLLVLPKRYTLPNGFQLPSTRHHHPGGVHTASSVGDAEEFISLREYREGDALRRIDWPGLARHNQLFVREYQSEFFTRHGLILDTFVTPTQDPSIFEEAVSLAATFAGMVESGEALLDLLLVGDRAYHFTAGRSIAHLEQILEILACVNGNTQESFEQLTALVLSQPAMLSGCVVILLTWDEPRSTLMQRLNDLGLPLVVLIVGPLQHNPMIPFPAWKHPASRLQVVPVGQAEEILARLAV